MTICILGRQPELGLAELQSLYGASKVRSLGEFGALVDAASDKLHQKELGGTIKTAELLATLDSTQWDALLDYCVEHLPRFIAHYPQGKLTFGLSVYGLSVKLPHLQRAGVTLKKVVRAAGRSARYVPNTSAELNSAQVLHNHLTSPSGLELLFISDGTSTYICRTVSVQDIDDYAKRDFGRPQRDPFVGMLPPKLAQIMLNLAQPKPRSTILDPFCGTGVVLMEAALRELAIQGTDLNPRMVEFTRRNIDWLSRTYRLSPVIVELAVADAQTHRWRLPVGSVVSETYLGQPLSSVPSTEKLNAIVKECDTIIRRFLTNLYSQIAAGTRCCIAVPAWRAHHLVRLPVVDDLKKIGYNQVSFSGIKTEELIYYRADQIVARQLLVLTRK